MSRALLVCTALLATATVAWPYAKKKKSEEELTQTREIPKDPPLAVAAETRRLVFHVSPLSSKGLLSQQTRDGLKALLRGMDGGTIVKLRAFVAGTGDMRRVQTIVSETFTEKKLALPALSVVQVGALPMEGAQVVLESIAVSKKEVNPNGLAFISGQGHSSDKPLEPLAPLAEKTMEDLRTAVRAAGSETRAVSRVTCFLTSFENLPAVRSMVEAEYSRAALNYVQVQRSSLRSTVECEAVARLQNKPAQPLQFLNPPGLSKSPSYSQIALVASPRVALTGTQIAFGFQDVDAQRAFRLLVKALESVGASVKDVAMSSLYPLSQSIAAHVGKIRFEFYDRERPPASTMLPFEALPSMDASFGVDVVAVLGSG